MFAGGGVAVPVVTVPAVFSLGGGQALEWGRDLALLAGHQVPLRDAATAYADRLVFASAARRLAELLDRVCVGGRGDCAVFRVCPTAAAAGGGGSLSSPAGFDHPLRQLRIL